MSVLVRKSCPVVVATTSYFSTHSSFHPEQIKLITFDITGTLLAFRKPPFQIYSEFGRKFGLDSDSEYLKVAFKNEYKKMSVEEPHFGRDWRNWWIQLVIRTFQVLRHFTHHFAYLSMQSAPKEMNKAFHLSIVKVLILF